MKKKIFYNSKQNYIPPSKFRLLNEIIKEKVLYENLCPIHHLNFKKFCSTCQKDICFQCEEELHKKHLLINYETLMPDLNETNIINEIIKEYDKNYNSFINIINDWKIKFDLLINDYKKKMINIIEFMHYFNNRKINFNSIYKYRIIYSLFLGFNDIKNEKNKKIIETMEKIDKNKSKKSIKNDYNWIINNNKLKELIIYLDNNNFINNINKIIEIICFNENNIKNLESTINEVVIKDKNLNEKNKAKKFVNNNEINHCFNNQIKNNSSSEKNKNTSASSIGNKNMVNFENEKNNIYNNKNNGIINFEYTFSKKDYKSLKSNKSKSTNDINHNNKMNNFNLCVYEKKKIRQKSIDLANNIKKINISFKNKNSGLNENTLQNSINDTKILLFHKLKRKDDMNKNNRNIMDLKAHNILNRTFLYDYKGFDINDKDSGPELLNNTSSVVQGIKYFSHSLINNSYEKNNNIEYHNKLRQKHVNLKSHSIDYKNNKNILLINKSNTINISNNLNKKHNYNMFKLSRNINYNKENKANLIKFYKPEKNKSVENINAQKIINNSLINNTINNTRFKYKKIYFNKKKENSIYVHKRFITLDVSKTLSSVDSITSSIISSNSKNKNIKGETNNIFLNENNSGNIYNKNLIKNNTYNPNNLKANKLYIGLELGNTECKIGFFKQSKSNFDLSNSNNNYLSFPTIISFISNKTNNYNIKIGKEAEKLRISNSSQTIFNIIKLFGKNTNEILGRKDLWPFNIYNNSKLNIPYIKIKNGNFKFDKKNKDIDYTFEEILSIYLKKVFEIFFNKLKFNNIDNKENYYNMNASKYIDIKININVGVPNYFNYLQRELIKKIFITNLFKKKKIYKKNNFSIKSNIYGIYNIQLNDIKIENVSNLSSFCLFDKYINNNIQKISKNYLILNIDGGSVNISIINLYKSNNNCYIEIKSIKDSEFGEEDFLDNFIYDCLSDFKEQIKNNCLNSPISLAKLRKSINNAKISFDKDEMNQIEVNINKLYGSLDLKMIVNKNIYYKSCIGLFRKIIYLIKEAIISSKIEIKDINDIILIGNITQNTKLKNMISDLFKDSNKIIYNKLISKNTENDKEINNYIIKGAIMQCFNNSVTNPKYKIINITHNSFGIESINGLMDIVIEKGSNIPIKINKCITIKKPEKTENGMININIYEGENKYAKQNKLIANNLIDIKNFKYEKKDDNTIEILFQFFIDSNNNLNVYILDTNNFSRQFECLVNFPFE